MNLINPFKFYKLSRTYVSYVGISLICFLGGCTKIEHNEPVSIKLGHYLFFETRLSFNNTKSCASCHNPEFAFTDGYRKSITSLGENVLRNAPSLINIKNYSYYTWADSTIRTLQNQHLLPLFGNHPVEMGLHIDSAKLFKMLSKREPYSSLLKKLGKSNLNENLVLNSISAYVKQIESFNSPYDKYQRGNREVLNGNQLKGMALFFSNEINCGRCHSLPNFTTNTGKNNFDKIFTKSEVEDLDSGLYSKTKIGSHIHKFRVPSLQNLSLTAPYFHNGSAATISDVLKIHPANSKLTKNEEKYIIAFLFSLTDSTIFANRLFQNPF